MTIQTLLFAGGPGAKRSWTTLFCVLALVGALAFFLRLWSGHPDKAWQSYLIQFLVFSAMAQGALVFSTLMRTVGARWSRPLENLAESFTAFFPVSLALFLVLFLGKSHVFPWLHQDLHGKESWLNVPFLFSRDVAGLLVLYGLGFAYLFHALWFKIDACRDKGRLRSWLIRRWQRSALDENRCRRRMNILAVLYMLAFALILSLIGYDLVMSADPHWYSTLFGAYSFIKAVYLGLGALIVLAAALHLHPGSGFGLNTSQFHDMGKLFFAFVLVWADFFYAQFLVIWYGNIPEETAYIIQRTLRPPWNLLAWTVFTVSFVAPFLILLNRRIKMRPGAMILICLASMAGLWLEHFLVLGPAFQPGAHRLPIGILDGLMALGFFGLMALAVTAFFRHFPELLTTAQDRPAAGEAG